MVTNELVATDIEELVLQWLDKRGIIDYEFQSSLMGGWYSLGGAVVDILFRERRLAWRIFGEYWHRGVVKSGQDLIQKEMLSELGWVVVDILSQDLETRPDETLIKALRGEEMLS